MRTDEETLELRIGWYPLLAGGLAFAAACAVFWSFDYPWTMRGDNQAVMFPMNLEAFRIWMTGRVPQWTDGIWGGFPLLADPTSMSLYWPNFLFFFLTPEPHLRAYDLATAFHAAVLTSGVVYLLRLLLVRPVASLLGGLLILMAPMHVWYASSMITGYAPVAWWPWMLVAAELISRDGARPLPVLVGWVAMASCALVYPEFALYGGVTASLWLLMPGAGRRPFLSRVLYAVILGAGGVALAAPQLVPTAAILPEMSRGDDLYTTRLTDVAQVTLSPDTLLYPGLEESIPSFIGIATLIMAVAGALSRAPRSGFLAATALLSILLAIGNDTALYPALRELPAFELFRQPLKFKLLTELAVALLVAIGFDHLWRRIRESVGQRFVMLLIGLMLMENATYLALRIPTGIGLPADIGDNFTSLYDRMMNSDLIGRVHGDPKQPVARAGEHVNLRGLPLIYGVPLIGGGANALRPHRHNWIVSKYNAPPGPNRFEMNYFGVEYDLGADPGSGWSDRNPCLTSAKKRGVLLVGRHDGTCLYHNRDRVDRFVVPWRVRQAADMDSMVRVVTDELAEAPVILTAQVPEDSCSEEPRAMTSVIVERLDRSINDSIPVVAPREEIGLRSSAKGRAGVVEYRPGDVLLQVAANRPAFLLVKESYYPGWHATVDGEPVPIYPAAGLFFALPFPAARHEVWLSYRAPGLETGVRIALAWIVFACLLELLRRGLAARGQARAEARDA